MIMNRKILLIVMICKIECVNILTCKINALVGNNSYYKYSVRWLKSDANFISSDLSVQLSLNNSVSTKNQYYDFFPYLNRNDK